MVYVKALAVVLGVAFTLGMMIYAVVNHERPEPVPVSSRRRRRRPSVDAYVSEICVICFDEKASLVKLNPCKHVCLCETCYAKMDSAPKCPLCRRSIDSVGYA